MHHIVQNKHLIDKSRKIINISSTMIVIISCSPVMMAYILPFNHPLLKYKLCTLYKWDPRLSLVIWSISNGMPCHKINNPGTQLKKIKMWCLPTKNSFWVNTQTLFTQLNCWKLSLYIKYGATTFSRKVMSLLVVWMLQRFGPVMLSPGTLFTIAKCSH